MGRPNQRIPRSEGPNTKGASKWQVVAKVVVVAEKAAAAEERAVVAAAAERVAAATVATIQALRATHLGVAEATVRVDHCRRRWWSVQPVRNSERSTAHA